MAIAREQIFQSPAGTKLLAHLAKETAGATVTAMGTLPSAKTRLTQAAAWVPATMSGKGFFPDAVTTLGRPWVWQSRRGALRSGPRDWPSFGIGQFVFGWEGHSVLVLFHASVFEQLAIPLTWAAERIRAMSALDLGAIFKSTVPPTQHHVVLTRSTAVWVPYGWVPMLMACPTESGADASVTGATLPFFSEPLHGRRRRDGQLFGVPLALCRAVGHAG